MDFLTTEMIAAFFGGAALVAVIWFIWYMKSKEKK